MEHYTKVLGRLVHEKQRAGFLNELEKFKQNLEDHRRISAELSSLFEDLSGLYEASRLNRTSISSLRDTLNLAALSLGLEPIPDPIVLSKDQS